MICAVLISFLVRVRVRVRSLESLQAAMKDIGLSPR